MYGDDYSSSHGGEKCMHSDHYDSKEAAKRAARMQGMSGCHSMMCNGEKVYMPGDSHSQYMDGQERNGGGLMGGGNGAGINPGDFGL
jgi:hypothetical protein